MTTVCHLLLGFCMILGQDRYIRSVGSKFKRNRYWVKSVMKFFTTILVVLLILLQQRLWFGKNSWPDYVTLKQEIVSQTKANQTLEHDNQLQYREIADLKDGLAAIEERARNQLGLVKANEDFFRIIE